VQGKSLKSAKKQIPNIDACFHFMSMKVRCHAHRYYQTTKQKAQPYELGNVFGANQVFLAPRAGLEPGTCGLTEKSII
jgi:hypothetical protein